MTNTKKIIQGATFFFIGYFMIYLMNQIMEPMITALEAVFTSTNMEGTIWLIAIIIWIVMAIVAPSILIIGGLKEQTGEKNPTAEITMGILIFIISILLTIRAWYMVSVFTSLAGTGLIAILFWVGFILMWTEITIVTPAYLIFKNTNK